jgi:pimeloyl-ACP methyl ester carboxylesterase
MADLCYGRLIKVKQEQFPQISAKDNEEARLLTKFGTPKEINLHGEAVRVVDIAPEKLKSETPTLMVPGFSATPEGLKDAILRTAEAGRRVISAYAPHGIETHRGEESDLEQAQARKLDMLLDLLDEEGIKKVNVIAHSEAAIYVTVAAILYPERFENIVLVEPAGLIGEDNFFDLLKRFLADVREQMKQDKIRPKAQNPSPLSVGIKSVLSDISESYEEVKAISRSDITPALKKLHELGIGVSIIHAVEDKIFPMEKIQQMIKADMIDGFYSVQGPHNSIMLYRPFGQVAEEALTALENKRSGKENED